MCCPLLALWQHEDGRQTAASHLLLQAEDKVQPATCRLSVQAAFTAFRQVASISSIKWTGDPLCRHTQPHAAPIQPAAVHSCAPAVAPGSLHCRLLLLAQPPELQHLQLLLVQLGHQPLQGPDYGVLLWQAGLLQWWVCAARRPVRCRAKLKHTQAVRGSQVPAAEGHVAGRQPCLLQAQLPQWCIQQQEPEGCLACTAGRKRSTTPRGAVCNSLPAHRRHSTQLQSAHGCTAPKSLNAAHSQTELPLDAPTLLLLNRCLPDGRVSSGLQLTSKRCSCWHTWRARQSSWKDSAGKQCRPHEVPNEGSKIGLRHQ